MDTYLIEKIPKIKFKITVFQDLTPGRWVDINPKVKKVSSSNIWYIPTKPHDFMFQANVVLIQTCKTLIQGV